MHALNKLSSISSLNETVGNHFIAGRPGKSREMEISSEKIMKSTQKVASKKGGLRSMPFIIGELLLLIYSSSFNWGPNLVS